MGALKNLCVDPTESDRETTSSLIREGCDACTATTCTACALDELRPFSKYSLPYHPDERDAIDYYASHQ